MNTQKTVSGLWVGDSLPFLAELSIRSYLAQGIKFQLFTYEPYSNIPEGTIIMDASAVIAQEDIFRHSTGSLAPFADWFRNTWMVEHGGIWTDLDVICLSPNLPDENEPWFALQEEGLAAVGVIAFPAHHPVIEALYKISDDPAHDTPWDSEEVKRSKQRTRTQYPDAVIRRKQTAWGYAGPDGFTQVLNHYNLLQFAAAKESIYPIPYTSWRNCFDGQVGLDSPVLAQSWAVHVWNEMFAREPYKPDEIHPESIVGKMLTKLMPNVYTSAGLTNSTALYSSLHKQAGCKILVGICSCVKAKSRRQAVRETWAQQAPKDIQCSYFVGRSDAFEPEEQAVQLNVNDSYNYLPQKVMAFFEYALENLEFEWLFKCDEDTYLDLERLPELCESGCDFIGNPWLDERGAPSGGAGYMLSRQLVERIVANKAAIPPIGAEDLLIGNLAKSLCCKSLSTPRLNYGQHPLPLPHNDFISAHWLSSDSMRALHLLRQGEASFSYLGRHEHWQDSLMFYENGVFCRKEESCGGRWHMSPDGQIVLEWCGWNAEFLSHTAGGYKNGTITLSDYQTLSPANSAEEEDSAASTDKTIAIIPAKKDSLRLVNKNTRIFCTLPLFLHSVNYARQEGIRPIVSTDSDEIIKICKENKIEFVREQVDDSTIANCIRQVLKEKECDYFVILQPTSPLRQSGMIQNMLKQCRCNHGECVITTQNIKLVGFIDGEFHRANRDQDSPHRFYFFDGAIAVSSRKAFERQGSLFTRNISGQPNPFPCNLQIDTEEEFIALDSIARESAFQQYLPSPKPLKVCIISNIEELTRDYSDFIDSCDIVLRISKMNNLDSGLTGQKKDIALVSCWRAYMCYSREDRHTEQLKQVEKIYFIYSHRDLVCHLVESEDLKKWSYLPQEPDDKTADFTTFSKGIALADYLYPEVQLYCLGDMDVASRTGTQSAHCSSGDNHYLRSMVNKGRLVPILYDVDCLDTHAYSQELPEQKKTALEYWQLKCGIKLDQFQRIPVIHPLWKDEIFIGRHYVKRAMNRDIGEIINKSDKQLNIKWENWGTEQFLFSSHTKAKPELKQLELKP